MRMLPFLFAEASPIFELFADRDAACRAPSAGDFHAIPWPSLHFIGAASKLTLLHWCKGNALRCFSHGIL